VFIRLFFTVTKYLTEQLKIRKNLLGTLLQRFQSIVLGSIVSGTVVSQNTMEWESVAEAINLWQTGSRE
jgi:hypothetical protein